MPDSRLETVRATAQRVQHLVDELEREPTPETRERWLAAMGDLRARIREARAGGVKAEAIHAATGGASSKRFIRPTSPILDVDPESVQLKASVGPGAQTLQP